MNTTTKLTVTKLSVSSAILAAVLSGCSQQQVIGGSQVSAGSAAGGSQQVAGGAQVAGSQQQIEGGAQVASSQQQVESAAPVVRAPVTVYQPRVIKQRVYTQGPKPRVTRSVRRSGLGLPPAKPGQCFAKVKVPATYKTLSKRVLIKKAAAKRVLVRAPQYRWVNKKVLVRKPSYKTRTLPAVYKTISQRVQVRGSSMKWVPGRGPIQRIDNMTGQIMCLIKVPPVYKTVKKRVLVRPAQTQRTLIPAVYKTVKVKQRVAGAVYKTVRTPARYKTVNYRVKTGSARYAWRSILCQTNAPKRAARHYRKAPVRHYRKAPQQYRKAAVMHKPVVRRAPARQYRASGVSYQDFLKVMRAGSGSKAKLSHRTKKSHKKVVLKKHSLKSKMKAKKPAKMKMAPKATKSMKMKAPASVAPATVKENPAKTSTETKAQTQANTENKSSSKKSIVYGIQKALKAKGFNPGSLDGKMGPGTAAALKAFQSSRGLPVGQLNKDTFRALGLIR